MQLDLFRKVVPDMARNTWRPDYFPNRRLWAGGSAPSSGTLTMRVGCWMVAAAT